LSPGGARRGGGARGGRAQGTGRLGRGQGVGASGRGGPFFLFRGGMQGAKRRGRGGGGAFSTKKQWWPMVAVYFWTAGKPKLLARGAITGKPRGGGAGKGGGLFGGGLQTGGFPPAHNFEGITNKRARARNIPSDSGTRGGLPPNAEGGRPNGTWEAKGGPIKHVGGAGTRRHRLGRPGEGGLVGRGENRKEVSRVPRG